MADVSTVVSIVPIMIPVEHGSIGVTFEIPPSSREKPWKKFVGPSKAHRYIDSERGWAEVYYTSDVTARTICDDYCNHVLGAGADELPGLFWLPGEVHKVPNEVLDERERMQKKWLLKLVHMADDDYNRTHQIRTVSELQREAARYLNLKRDWMNDNPNEFTACPACMSQLKTGAVICPQCRTVVNQDAYAKFQTA